MAAYLAGQLLQLLPGAFLGGAGVGGRLQGGGVEVRAEGQGLRVGLAQLAEYLGFQLGEVGIGNLGQGAVLLLGEAGV